MLRSENSAGAARTLKSWQASRRMARSSFGTKERKLDRHSSLSQKVRKVLELQSTKLHTDAKLSEPVPINVRSWCGGYVEGKTRVHRSLLVSRISPKSNLLPPLLELVADVAEPADEILENAVDGLLTRTFGECLSCFPMMKEWVH